MTDERPHQWDVELEPLPQVDRDLLDKATRDPNAVTTSTITSQKLGLFSTACMIINRIIGTGIFSTPASILRATGSPGASLLVWAAGAIISFAGLMVYMEFGLSIPRYTKDGETKAVPRSGGEKNYLEYVYKTPKYLTTCVYGAVFIVLGNTAGNAISFAQNVLRARGVSSADIDQYEWQIKGIAVAAVTGACLLHGSWRAAGIWVNNFFAIIKCCLVISFILAGLIFSGKGTSPTYNLNLDCSFVKSDINGIENDHCPQNISSDTALGGIYGYSQSLLLVIFAYGGFENANYILSEIDRPKRTYKWASMASLGLITILYMLLNIVYYLVVPRGIFMDEDDQFALKFFMMTVSSSPNAARTTIASFLAFSSFGNIIVVTFIASRVKQEIAKEGVLPFSLAIASDMQTPFSWLRNKFFGPASNYREENTPVAALCLHWLFSFILVISPKTTDAYLFLLLLHSYAIHVWVGFFLAAGLVYLHLQRNSDWSENRGFKPYGSWAWALLYAVVNLFLICIAWLPPPDEFKTLLLQKIKFFVYPTVTVSLMMFGVFYWFGFAYIYPRIIKRVLNVKRFPVVQHGVQTYEAVFFNWVVPGDLDDDDDDGVELKAHNSSSPVQDRSNYQY